MRVTSPRVAVLGALYARPHATADALTADARRSLGAVSRQAVYDALDAFGSAGLVRRIEPAGSPVRYETRTGDNHHHLVCRSCGTVEDVDCVVASAPCLTPSDYHGFTVDEAEVVFWGRCAVCQPVARPAPPESAPMAPEPTPAGPRPPEASLLHQKENQ